VVEVLLEVRGEALKPLRLNNFKFSLSSQVSGGECVFAVNLIARILAILSLNSWRKTHFAGVYSFCQINSTVFELCSKNVELI
jgi:hypothetical protein